MQEIINGFAKEMQEKGYTIMKCPECLGAIWIEGDASSPDEFGNQTHKNLKLMRYSTKDSCQKCSELHTKVCEPDE